MNEGLVTRIGQWIDNKWESKATVRQVNVMTNLLEEAHNALADKVMAERKELDAEILEMRKEVLLKLASYKADSLTADKELTTACKRLDEAIKGLQAAPEEDKGLAELMTRIERLEVYSGMTRKIDPTKPPVVKSAFSM